MTMHTHYPMLGEKAKKDRRLPCEIKTFIPKPYRKIIDDPKLREGQMTVGGKPLDVTDYSALQNQWDRERRDDIHTENDSGEEVKYMAESIVSKAKPEHIRAGALSVTIWTNKGENGTYKTFSFQRSYMDKNKEWQKSESLRGQDLLPLAELLRKAYDMYVATKEKTE